MKNQNSIGFNSSIDSKRDPNRVDPTKQDERDNDPTRIKPMIKEPDKNDPTQPEKPTTPQPQTEPGNDQNQKTTVIGFRR
jgi:hypothetical protein